MKELIEKATKIVILTHKAPDGDAMGSSLALWHYIRSTEYRAQNTDKDSPCSVSEAVGTPSAQRSVTVIVPNAFPAFFNWMPGADAVKVYEQAPDACNAIMAEADLFICTDFCSPQRIDPVGAKMLENPAPKIVIDHHLTREHDCYAVAYIDPSASSACEIVYRLLTENTDRSTDRIQNTDIATCLYTGLMTDTGNFSYSSSRPEVFEMAAALLRAGIDKDGIHQAVFDQFSIDRIRLTGFALYRKMRIYPENHVALITLSADELDQFHYQPGDCEGLVNMPLQIGDVYYSILMREDRAKPGTKKPRIRISFRSLGNRSVSFYASRVFHGGGHKNASGADMLGSLDQAIKTFEKTYKTYLK